MTSRITPHQQFQSGQVQLRLQAARTARLREQISSGIRVHRPSDDPRAQALILNQDAVISHLSAQRTTIQYVRSVLNESQIQVQTAQQLVVNANDIVLRARQISDPSEARSYALEINGILESLESVANARYAGKYLFAGTEARLAPYPDLVSGTDYQGAAESGTIGIAGAGHIKTWYSGRDVFTTGAAGETLVRGSTGAAGATGTASGHGTSQLQVTHLSTTYSGTSGISPGTASPGGDTIIGPAGSHRLTVTDTSGTGASGTLSLNGGPEVAFSSTDTSLTVTGPEGEVVYVNTTAITAGFSGTVDIAADGTLSLDGGVTSVPIDFSARQTLTDEAGNVRHIDSSGIRYTGTDEVSLTGSIDVFEVLRSLRDDLFRFEELSSEEWDQSISRGLANLNQASDHLLDVLGEQSVDTQSLDRLEERGEELQLAARTRLSELESTDMTEAVLRLQEEQNLTAFAYASLSSVLQISVLDFLT